MKNLGNTFRIIGIVSASLLLFGTGAHAASKPGKKPLTIKARRVNNTNVIKVEKITLNHLPFGASGPSGNAERLRSHNPGNPHDVIPAAPDNPLEQGVSVERLRTTAPTKFNGYFMKRYALLQNVQNTDEPGGISPQIAEIPIAPVDPTFNAFQWFVMPELFWASDRINPRYLPGPEWEPPNPCTETDRYWDYIRDNRKSDRLDMRNIDRGSLERMDSATLGKAMEILNTNRDSYDGESDYANQTLNEICNGGEKGKDSGNDDSGGSDNGGKPTKPDATVGKPVEDETGSQPDADKDSDPEGDDPDEFRTPTSEMATRSAAESATPVMAARHQAAAGSSGSGGSGSGNQGSMPQGGGLHNDPRNNPSYREPEGGRPDEMSTPVASGALNSAVNAGHNLQPEPGGDDPDDPRASEGSMRAASSSLGYAASPPDGGQSGETGPTDPRF